VVGADAGGGEGDGLAHVRRAGGGPGLDLLGGHADGLRGQVGAVELARVVEDSVEPPRAHRLQHLGCGRIDISRRSPALVQEGAEGGGEVGVGEGEAAHGGGYRAWRARGEGWEGSRSETGTHTIHRYSIDCLSIKSVWPHLYIFISFGIDSRVLGDIYEIQYSIGLLNRKIMQ
jgi:hypothetical protein